MKLYHFRLDTNPPYSTLDSWVCAYYEFTTALFLSVFKRSWIHSTSDGRQHQFRRAREQNMKMCICTLCLFAAPSCIYGSMAELLSSSIITVGNGTKGVFGYGCRGRSRDHGSMGKGTWFPGLLLAQCPASTRGSLADRDVGIESWEWRKRLGVEVGEIPMTVNSTSRKTFAMPNGSLRL